jgi:hypothetical protein
MVEVNMSKTTIVISAIFIFIVDVVTFFFPITPILMLIVVFFQPKFFKKIVDTLYEN